MPPKRYSGIKDNPAYAALRRGNFHRDRRESNAQISYEQLLAEAADLQQMTDEAARSTSTKLMITSKEELALYRQKTRNDFEEIVSKSFQDFSSWIRYAEWEIEQRDFTRMRSVFNRCVAHHGEKPDFWRRFAECETKIGALDAARGVWERAIASHPQNDELWLKYLLLEQSAHDDMRTRSLFHRWLQSSPAPPAYVWVLVIKFETARGSIDNAREHLRQFVVAHNHPRTWELYARLEWKNFGNAQRAADVLKVALQSLPDAYLHLNLHFMLADCFVGLGEFTKAKETYESLLLEVKKATDGGSERASELALQAYSAWAKFVRENQQGLISGDAATAGAQPSGKCGVERDEYIADHLADIKYRQLLLSMKKRPREE